MKLHIYLSLLCFLFCVSGHKWENWGGGIDNARYQEEEYKIHVGNVGRLEQNWVVETRGDVSCTPTERHGIVYFTDFGGAVYAVDETSGDRIWRRFMKDLTGVNGSTSRTSPIIVDDKVVIGTAGRNTRERVPLVQGPVELIALDRLTGDLIWSTTLDDHSEARITQSGTHYNGHIYVGLSAFEEISAADDDYECCTFRGSAVKVDVNTGDIIWKTYMTPDHGGSPDEYSGVPIWGSSPSIDPVLNLVFMATGNTYKAPQSVIDCLRSETQKDEPNLSSCIADDVYPDAIVALDITTGEVVWATLLEPITLLDPWNAACLEPLDLGDNCPEGYGPDFDFGQAPMLASNSDGVDVVLIAQKSGMAWSLDRATGSVLWGTQVGASGQLGGSQWGSATDGNRFYVASTNYYQINTTLINGDVTNGGHWAALDILTGEKIWETAVPVTWESGSDLLAWAHGPVSVANGVLYGGTTDVDGHMFAMDAATGEILFEFASGGTMVSGAAISNGCIFFGCGYRDSIIGRTGLFALATECRKVYSLCVQ